MSCLRQRYVLLDSVWLLIIATAHYLLIHMQKFSSTKVVPQTYLVVYTACILAGKQGIFSCQTYCGKKLQANYHLTQ